MKLKELKILVTGGAGFIGSWVVDALLKLGNDVIVYDNFNDFYQGKEKNIQHNLNKKNFTLIRGDILDYSTLIEAMDAIDLVIHEAAQANVRYSLSNPLIVHNINVTGTLNVLMAAKEAKVQKVINASSSSVYGIPQKLPINENHPLRPNSPYALSKLLAEKYCHLFFELYELNVVTLRYFSVYGPRQRPDLVIHSFIKRVWENKPPLIYGDGTQTRDFTFIDDIVQATLLAAEKDNIAGEIFNIGYGDRTNINEIAKAVIRLLGKEGKIEPMYKPSYTGDFPHTQADITKARELLSYEPKINLSDGLQIFKEWFIQTNF